MLYFIESIMEMHFVQIFVCLATHQRHSCAVICGKRCSPVSFLPQSERNGHAMTPKLIYLNNKIQAYFSCTYMTGVNKICELGFVPLPNKFNSDSVFYSERNSAVLEFIPCCWVLFANNTVHDRRSRFRLEFEGSIIATNIDIRSSLIHFRQYPEFCSYILYYLCLEYVTFYNFR